MATTTTWSIQWMQTSTQEINGFPEVVLTIGWNLEGSDGTYTSNIYSTVSVNPPQEGDPDFTPYEDLTEEQVLGWVWENGVDKDAAEATVTEQVANLVNPPVVQPPLPWAS